MHPLRSFRSLHHLHRAAIVVIAIVLATLSASAIAAGLPLDRLHLPPGFRIEVLTDAVPQARAMALGHFADGRGVVYVGSGGAGKVYAVEVDAGKARVHTIASGLNLPIGVAYRDGALYVSSVSRILRFDGVDQRLSDPPAPHVVTDRLPPETHHGGRFIAFGPDGLLYFAVGAPCNICNPDPTRYANIQRMKPDGSGLERVAHGIRNSVGFDWSPRDHSLWLTDNGRDLMGDDVPSDELNHVTQPDPHFGYPFCHQGDVADPEFGAGHPCSEYVAPAAKLGAHVAALGMRFYTGQQFPRRVPQQPLHRRTRFVEPQPQGRLPGRARRRRCARQGRQRHAVRRGLAAARRRPGIGLGPPGRCPGAARRLAADQRRPRRRDLPGPLHALTRAGVLRRAGAR